MADGEKQYVPLPDGSYLELPAEMKDEEINEVLRTNAGNYGIARAPTASMRPAETFGEKLRKVAGYTPMDDRKLGRPEQDPSALQRIAGLTTPIEGYTEQGRAEHPILSRIGDVTRGLKDYGRLVEPMLPLIFAAKGTETGPPSGGGRRMLQPPPPRPPNYSGNISGLMTPDEPAPQRGLPPAPAQEQPARVEMPYRAERPEVMERNEPAPETLPTTTEKMEQPARVEMPYRAERPEVMERNEPAPETLPQTRREAPPEAPGGLAGPEAPMAPEQMLTRTRTSDMLDRIAMQRYGRSYDALPQELKVQVVREIGGPPGGVERRVTPGEGPVREMRASTMPAAPAGPEGGTAPTPPGTLPNVRPGQPMPQPTPSETLPRTGSLPPAPPPQTLGGAQPPRPTFPQEAAAEAAAPAPKEMTLEDWLSQQPGATPPDPFKKEFPDPKIRQFGRTNGFEIVRSGASVANLQAVQDLSNVQIREAAINSGIDLGTKHVGSRQGLGPEQVSRQDLIDQMIRDKNVKPEDIPELAKPRESEPGALQKIIEQLKGEEGYLDISFGRNKPGPLKKMVSAEEGTQHTAEKLVRPNDGLPANPEPLVLEKDGKTYYFGPLSRDQFSAKWEQQLTSEEIEEIRKWYEQVGQLFKENFGDTPQTPRKLVAWLTSQRNTPPARGMQNVFRAEDVLAGFPKVHGMLGEDVINTLLRGETPASGLGPKLHDFVDSAYGRETRTWMGDRPQGGKPAVIDVHSGRGTGYYDDTLIKFIRKNWGDEIADGLVRDLGHGKSGAPNALQYERGSERYNQLADELNGVNYHGGNWKPLQVQAVDWVANGLQTGRQMEVPADIFTKNTQRVMYELRPSPDAPYGKMFAWDKLSPEQGAAITRDVSEATMKTILKEAGGYRVHQVYGPGGYLTKLNPSAVTSHMGSPEATDRAMDLLGHLFQQDQVIAYRGLKGGDAYAIEFRETGGGQKLADPAIVQKFWNTVRENFPQAEGFNPVRDRSGAGMQILKYEGKWSDAEIAQAQQALEKAANEVGIKNGVTVHEAGELRQSNNDWKANPKGEERLNRLATTGRPGVVRRIQAEYEPRVLSAIRSAFKKYAPDLLPRK